MDDIKATLDKIASLNEEHKAAVDKHSDEIAQLGEAKSETVEKLEKINAAIDATTDRMDELEKAANRMTETDSADQANKEYADNFMAHVRNPRNAEIQNSLEKTTDGQGGLLVPEDWAKSIHMYMEELSPMRQVASVQKASTPEIRIPVSQGEAGAEWRGEVYTASETGTPTVIEVAPTFGELIAEPHVTQQLLEDAGYDVLGWLNAKLAEKFALTESDAFIQGDGTNKPTGMLNSVDANVDGVRAQGTLQYFDTGVDAGFAATDPGDSLIDLVYSIKSHYRPNAKFLMNRATLAEVRKMKDGQGNYLWQPSFKAGEPATVAGYPVIEMPGMPDLAAESLSVAFGDFKKCYQIWDRVGLSMLVDPYTVRSYVKFVTRKRVGGIVVDSEAVKLLRMSDGA